jgi:hypothetical protein
MRSTPFLALLALALLASCGEKSGKAGYQHCYYGATDRDTTSLYFNQEGDHVRGEMSARYFNLEPQTGRFKGSWKGDILEGEFRYPQEGQDLIREVHFKRLEDGRLVEGFGNRLTVDGKLVYEHSGFLNFEHVHRLTSEVCR